MKRSILYIFSLSMISLSTLAQIPRGTSLVGGSISLSHQQSKGRSGSEVTSNSVNLLPNYGLFVIDNLCVGVNAGFTLGKSEEEPISVAYYTSSATSRSFNAGPFVRYYIPVHPKLYPFAQAAYGWEWLRTETESTNPNVPSSIINKATTNSWTAGAGLAYFLNPNIALEASLSYTHDRMKNDTPSSDNSAMVTRKTGGLAFSIGLQIYLRKAE